MLLPLRALCPELLSRLGDLVTQEAGEGLADLLCRLPVVATWGCFELRLSAEDPRVDFSFCISRADGGSAATSAALSAGEEVPGWNGIRALLAEWSRPESALARAAPLAWLEYDLPGGSLQEPCPFFSFRDLHQPGRTPSPAELRTVLDSLLLLPDRRGDEPRVALLERCVRSLPAGGCVFHVGTLPAWRRTQALRLNVGLSWENAPSWLAQLGWPQPERQWQPVVDLVGAQETYLQIGLDLDETVRPVLAPEISRPSADWPPLVERLVEQGLSTEGKARAVLAWSGSERVDLPGAEWIVRLDRALESIKIVVEPGGRVHAKAYLGFALRYALF